MDDRFPAEALELTGSPVVHLDRAGRVRAANGAARRLLGAAAAPGAALGEGLAPQERAALAAAIEGGFAAAPGQGARLVTRLVAAGTGFPLLIAWTLDALPGAPGEPASLLAVGQDVTRLEGAIEEERQLFRSALEYAPDAIVVVEPSGKIVLANSQAEAYFGYARDEILGREVEMLVPDRFKAVHPALRARYFEHPRVRPMGSGLEPTGQRKDGSEFPIDASLGPIHTVAGPMTMAIVRDISQRRSNERELTRRARELEQLNQELAASDRHKDEFLAVVSHELRTPLNFIMGFASLLEDEAPGALNPQQAEFVGKILSGAERMLRLSNNLITASRIQAGKLALVPASVSYAGVIEEAIGGLRPLAAGRGVALRIDDSVAREVCLDAQLVMVVLSNLVDNAIKFSPDGGEVTIRAFLRGNVIVTEVVDQGSGIAPELLATLFRPFHQLDMSATREAGGLGLGLSLSKALVEAHEGTIGVHSTPGEGSEFWFELPLADCD